jgi:hypothetical protein
MTVERPEVTLVLSARFLKSRRSLSEAAQSECDDALEALRLGQSSSGLRIKPILPGKHYLEARVNRGDRIIFRREGNKLLIIDVVSHDEIKRYGLRAKP